VGTGHALGEKCCAREAGQAGGVGRVRVGVDVGGGEGCLLRRGGLLELQALLLLLFALVQLVLVSAEEVVLVEMPKGNEL